MRLMSVKSLAPGMIIGRPVYNSNGHVLLSEGTVLTSIFIKRLAMLGISRVYVEDGLLPDIDIEDVILEETRTKAITTVKRFINNYSNGNELTAKGAAVLCRDMMNTVLEIVDQLLVNRSMLVNLLDIRTFDEYTFRHSVNVCVLSLLTGITLGYNRKRLMQLGLGAMLHDIGKTKIPAGIIKKPEQLTPDEFEEVKKHCYYGFELIKQTGIEDVVVASVALQHHERQGGGGYPRGLRKNDIHEFAKIVSVADAYDAITADRVYKKASLPHEAYQLLSESVDSEFDSNILKAFLYNIAAYPIGTIVEINTGEIGAVVETKKGYSQHPRIRLLFTQEGKYIDEICEICLYETEKLYVVRVVENLGHLMATGKLFGKNIG